MAKGDALRIRRYLVAQVAMARERGDTTITLRSSDVHKALGLVARMPNVCQVMTRRRFHEQAKVEQVRCIECPPSCQSSRLTIEFRIL